MPITTYIMAAKENYDPAHVTAIEDFAGDYTNRYVSTDQNYQGVQWDPVRRNFMYMYTEWLPTTPTTNTTGYHLWDGGTAGVINPGDDVDPSQQFNSSVCVKSIDTGDVTFYLNYNSANVVPSGIGGSDGTYRRYTSDFFSGNPFSGNGNGPGMTDPYTGNFWPGAESCELYCFRPEDNYSQIISPLQPVLSATNNVHPLGFTNTGATKPWTFAREIDASSPTGNVYLYLVPRLITAAETAADYILVYATFTYPVALSTALGYEVYTAYNREVFDNAGNMYVFSCNPTGGKDFALYLFAPPTSAPYGGPTVGGGFTTITPWGGSSGPNADGATYTLQRHIQLGSGALETADIIPMYLPLTNTLVLIEKFFPSENTVSSTDPALMFWSCTYVDSPQTSPTFTHFSAFVTGYMTADWTPTDISGAAYSVTDAFEVNNYLGQSDYAYDIDYTTRWFFFVCTNMSGGVSDGMPWIVLVQYKFSSGSAPQVVQVIDEQGWDSAYPDYGPFNTDGFPPYSNAGAGTVAVSMNTVFNPDALYPLWDAGVYDPVTNSFWWSGGGSKVSGDEVFFPQFDPAFADRLDGSSVRPGATPPFMRLTFGSTPPAGSIPGTWLMERMDNRIWASVEDAYAVDSGVSNPMASPAANLTASTSDPGAVTFTADAAVFSSANVGDVIRMGGGIATISAYVDTQNVTGTWVLPGDPWSTGDPYSPSGDWTIATPVSALYAPHLTGRDDLVGLADGVPIGPLTASGQFGYIPLPFAASNVKVGLSFTAQMQTAYLNGPQVAQGARKVIPAVTVRLAASGPFEFGTNQPDGGAQNPQQLAPAWTNMTPANLLAPTGGQSPPPIWTSPGGQPVVGTFTGDLRVVGTGGAWISKGQVAVQQTLPMALEVTSIEPESLEGDAPEQTYQQQGGAQGGAQNQQQPRPPGRHMLSGPPRI